MVLAFQALLYPVGRAGPQRDGGGGRRIGYGAVNINRQNGVELKVTLEAFGQDHKQEILNGLRSEGYSVHEVKTADFYN